MSSDDKISNYSIGDQIVLGSLTTITKPKYLDTIKKNVLNPLLAYSLRYIQPIVFIIIFVFFISILINVFVLIKISKLKPPANTNDTNTL